MVEYMFYPMNNGNMNSYPYAIRKTSLYTYNVNGARGSGFYRSKRSKNETNDVDFFKSKGNLLEMGYKLIATVDYTGLYIEKENVDENDVVNNLFGYGHTRVVFEFYETNKTVSGLGYVFRQGWNGKGYYLDKPTNFKEVIPLKDMYVSLSLSELGYKHGEFWCGKQGYYRIKPQNPTKEDIVKLLFIKQSVFPSYIASRTCFHNIPGYVFQNKASNLGYHKEVQDCNNDIDMILAWFKEIEKSAETSSKIESSLQEKNSEIQRLSLALNQKDKQIEAMNKEKDAAVKVSQNLSLTLDQKEKLIEAITKEKETAFSVSQKVINTLQQDVELAKSTIVEKDLIIQDLEGVVQSLLDKQGSAPRHQCDTCEILNQQLQEKDKHIAWLLTQVSTQTTVRTQETNLIDL